MQNISGKEETCPLKNRTESEGYVEGQTYMWMTEKDVTNNNLSEYGLLEFQMDVGVVYSFSCGPNKLMLITIHYSAFKTADLW